MKKVLALVATVFIASASHAQIGLGQTITITDVEGHNVLIEACTNFECDTHTFSSDGDSYTYASPAHPPYNNMYLNWTTSGQIYTLSFQLSDVNNAPSGSKSYTIYPSSGSGGPAAFVITKTGRFSYSFIIETNTGN